MLKTLIKAGLLFVILFNYESMNGMTNKLVKLNTYNSQIESNPHQILSSLKNVTNLFQESIKDNDYAKEIRLISDSILSLLESEATEIDSCNSIIEIASYLQNNSREIEALKLLLPLHLYFQTIQIEKRAEYLLYAKVKVYIGITYNALRMEKIGSEYIDNALIIYMKFDDYQNISVIKQLKGIRLMRAGQYEEAKEMINQSININQKYNNNKNLYTNFNTLALIYDLQKNDIAAIDYFKKALNKIEPYPEFPGFAYTYNNLSHQYNKIREIDSAKKYLQLAFNQNYEPSNIFLYLTKAQIMETLGSDDSSLFYLHKVIDIWNSNKSLALGSIVLKELHQYYNRRGDYKNGYKYLYELNHIQDSIIQSINTVGPEIIKSINTIYELELENNLLSQKIEIKKKELKNKIFLWSLIAIIVIIIIVLYILLLNSKKKHYRTLAQNLKMSRELAKNDNAILLQKENELKKEIDYKKRQLTVSSIQIINYNKFLQKIINELQSLCLSFKTHESRKRKYVYDIIRELNRFNSNQNLKEFRIFFEEVHPKFYSSLSSDYPNLSQNELRLCALIRLGLSSKEISAILFIEIRSVESARNRVRKKLGIPIEESLLYFLTNY